MYAVDINLPIYPFKDKLDPRQHYSTKRHYLLSSTLLNYELKCYLLQRNLGISHAEFFYSDANKVWGIHRDGVTSDDIAKLNYQWGGKDSVMYWYNAAELSKVDSLLSLIGTNFIGYKNTNNVAPIHSHQITFPTLIQAAIPHSVTTKDEPRWILSLVLNDGFNNALLKLQ